jgi:hypothetical protein
MTDIREQIERLRRYSYQQGTDDEQGQLLAELVGDMHSAADTMEKMLAVVEAWEKFEPFKYTVTQEDIDRGYFIIDDRDGNPCRIAITGVPGDIISWKDDG